MNYAQNRVIAAFLCITIAIGWYASHAPPSPSQRPTAENDHSNTKTLEERHEATEEAIANYTLWLMAFTGILAFATAGLGAMNFFQLRLARAEFFSSHRPLLRLKHIWFATPDGQQFFRHIQSQTPITVRLDIVNVGNTAAFVRAINFMTYFLPLGQRLPQRPPYNEPGVPQVPVGDVMLESGRTLTLPITVAHVLSAENIEALRDGQSRLYFIGTIEYWWGVDRDHLRGTAFCRYLRFEWPRRPDDTGRFQIENDPDYEYQD